MIERIIITDPAEVERYNANKLTEPRECSICGRTFWVVREGKGKYPTMCSDECRRKYQIKKTSEYLIRRYHEDPEFRKRRIAGTTRRNAHRRAERQDALLERLVQELDQCDTLNEMKAVLQYRVRINVGSYKDDADADADANTL